MWEVNGFIFLLFIICDEMNNLVLDVGLCIEFMSYYVDEIIMGLFEGCFFFFGLDGYFFEVLECVFL